MTSHPRSRNPVDGKIVCQYDLTMSTFRQVQSTWSIYFRGTILVCLGFLVLGSGCSRDPIDERDPNLRRARVLKNAEDYEGAVAMYEKALRRKPGLARAHWELATLYDQVFADDIRAIYHYQKYLELDPEAERRDLVEDLISVAKVSFAASLPQNSDEAIREVRRLQRENAALADLLSGEREVIRDLRAQLAGVPVQESGDNKPPPPAVSIQAPKPMPAQPSEQIYVVQAGDTLSRIATRVYNNPALWERIYEANRETLRSPESIRVGQTLRIPQNGN